MFSLCSTFLTSLCYVRGNLGKFRGKVQRFKEHRARIHRGYFSLSFKILTLFFVREASAPLTPKSNYELALLVFFLKVKARDSKNHLAANIFKSGFSKGEIIKFFITARRHSLIFFLWILDEQNRTSVYEWQPGIRIKNIFPLITSFNKNIKR